MRAILTALVLLTAAPATADVTYSVEGRFGVAYSHDAATGQTQARPMYEGRYTTTFSHQADNGVRFRFDLGIVVGNLDSVVPYPRPGLTDAPGFSAN